MAEALDETRAIFRRPVQIAHIARDELFGRAIAEHVRERGIGVENRAVERRPVDPVRGALNQRSVARLGTPQPLFGVFLPRDVACDRLHADDGVTLVDELYVLAEPQRLA